MCTNSGKTEMFFKIEILDSSIDLFLPRLFQVLISPLDLFMKNLIQYKIRYMPFYFPLIYSFKEIFAFFSKLG